MPPSSSVLFSINNHKSAMTLYPGVFMMEVVVVGGSSSSLSARRTFFYTPPRPLYLR